VKKGFYCRVNYCNRYYFKLTAYYTLIRSLPHVDLVAASNQYDLAGVITDKDGGTAVAELQRELATTRDGPDQVGVLGPDDEIACGQNGAEVKTVVGGVEGYGLFDERGEAGNLALGLAGCGVKLAEALVVGDVEMLLVLA